MVEALLLVPALSAGILIGILFFGGLCFTIRKGLSSEHPALWFFSSWLLRMTLVVGGFYLIAAGQLGKLLACTAGFFTARFIVKIFMNDLEKTHNQTSEAKHAPQS
jgi:F1F0 ATPase subunit 2